MQKLLQFFIAQWYRLRHNKLLVLCFSRFMLIGIFNTFIGYVIIFSGMYLLQFSAEFSNFLAYAIGLFISYLGNKNFVFRSTSSHKKEFIRFVIVYICAYGLNLISLLLLIHIFDVHPALSQLLATGVYVVAIFTLNHSFVFKASEPLLK